MICLILSKSTLIYMTEIQFFVPPILSFNSSSSVQVIINPTCESLDQIELQVRQRYYENLKHSINKRETLRNARRYLIYDKPPEKKQKKKKRKCPSGRCFNNYDLYFPNIKLICLLTINYWQICLTVMASRYGAGHVPSNAI